MDLSLSAAHIVPGCSRQGVLNTSSFASAPSFHLNGQGRTWQTTDLAGFSKASKLSKWSCKCYKCVDEYILKLRRSAENLRNLLTLLPVQGIHNGVFECWPSTACVELVLIFVERLTATGASVHAVCKPFQQCPTIHWLSGLHTQNLK